MASTKIIGIDLGTTNSVVAVMEGAQPKVLINQQGSRLTPSVVAFTDKGERLVGQPARHQQITNPKNTVFSIKRFMGRRHNEVSTEEKMVPYEIVGGPEELVKVRIRGKDYTPPEISAMILQELKRTAEDYLGDKVERAVITVPAYFNDSQRQATKDAGEIAGLKVERIINEPTAAALAYGLDKEKEQKILVYDLGGGTFDVSILEIGEGVFEVIATDGDTQLGGDDFDRRIMDWLLEEFRKDTGIDLSGDPAALQRLKEAAEQAKKELSSRMETRISLPYLTVDASGPKHLERTLTRARFEAMIDDLLQRTMRIVDSALEAAKLSPDEIDQVVLVGGSTRIPKVQELVARKFGRAKINKEINPDEVVALGAALQAAVLAGEMKEIVLLDVTPLTLSVETLGGIATPIIERNTTIPVERTKTFTTAEDFQTQVEIHIVQGERKMAADNRSLGKFVLSGIPPAPRGVPQIDVTFRIDADGILHVTARDRATGKEASITIKETSRLSPEEIERMRKEAEQYAEEDKRKLELAQAKNEADQLAYTVEKALKELGDKVPAEKRDRIQAAIRSLRETLEKKDADATTIRQATEELKRVSAEVMAEAYQRAAEGAEAAAGSAEEKEGK